MSEAVPQTNWVIKMKKDFLKTLLSSVALLLICLSSVHAATDQYEPDNTSAGATSIQPGVSAAHSISPNTDEDWVSFNLQKTENIQLKTTGPTTGGIQMTLFDHNLTVIKDDGNFAHPNIKREALSPGTYYARIKHYPGHGEVSQYNIVLTTTTGDGDPFEPNNVSADATRIQPGTTTGFNIIPENDKDWITFTATTLSKLKLEVTGPTTGMALTLYDHNLAKLDDSRSFAYPKITYDKLPPGTYYAKLETYPPNHGSIDQYNINLNLHAGASVFDVDGNGDVDALTDGLLILRHAFGFSGDALINNAVADGASRKSAAQIKAYLESK